ncbi:hypothetical protein T12_8579 [Trichinella patagoniensis]|uniref:Uncharacterized protein n=1 Tax=Trichinella patagoniensis TaxID=990121 RepID=A0A0V0ZA76_9BILA|nr:hypothetical protein T12_8579 [Trichinella patagoniensis]
MLSPESVHGLAFQIAFTCSRTMASVCPKRTRNNSMASSLRQSLASPPSQPELHRINLAASTRTSKRRPTPSDYGHTPKSGPKTLGIRAPYPKAQASSVPGDFPSHLPCCYCGGRGRWIWLNNRTMDDKDRILARASR